MCREGNETLPDKAEESTLLWRSGGESGSDEVLLITSVFPSSETGMSGNFWGRITRSKYRFALQIGTWELLLGSGKEDIPFFHFIFFSFWLCLVTCGILVPQPGIEPVPPALEPQSLNHWTPREVPRPLSRHHIRKQWWANSCSCPRLLVLKS